MKKIYWTCYTCGKKNPIGINECQFCGSAVSDTEISEALKDSGIKEYRQEAPQTFEEYLQESSEPNKRNKSRVMFLLKKFSQVLLLISLVAVIYGVGSFLVNGHFKMAGIVLSHLFQSIKNILVNLFNYFLNFKFSNNVIVKMVGMLWNNISHLIQFIYKNIVGIFSNI